MHLDLIPKLHLFTAALPMHIVPARVRVSTITITMQKVFIHAFSVIFLLDPSRGLWSAVHTQPVGHISLPRCPETQPVPPLSHSHCSAATVEPHICHERSQPEVFKQEPWDIHHWNLYRPFVLTETFLFRLLSQCTEYFDLRCQLLDDLTSKLIHIFFSRLDMKTL